MNDFKEKLLPFYKENCISDYEVDEFYELNKKISQFILYFARFVLPLQCCSNQTADILRKQPCFVPSENLDNSQHAGMKTEVVHPIMYFGIHPPLWGWVFTYIHWCELISFFCIQVVQNLQMKNERGSHLFVSNRVITKKQKNNLNNETIWAQYY